MVPAAGHRRAARERVAWHAPELNLTPVPTRLVAPTEGEPVAPPTAHEAVQPGRRRRFTASEKLRLVKAAEAASGERRALEALLRKEGIYSSHLSSWRRQLGIGARPA